MCMMKYISSKKRYCNGYSSSLRNKSHMIYIINSCIAISKSTDLLTIWYKNCTFKYKSPFLGRKVCLLF